MNDKPGLTEAEIAARKEAERLRIIREADERNAAIEKYAKAYAEGRFVFDEPKGVN